MGFDHDWFTCSLTSISLEVGMQSSPIITLDSTTRCFADLGYNPEEFISEDELFVAMNRCIQRYDSSKEFDKAFANDIFLKAGKGRRVRVSECAF